MLVDRGGAACSEQKKVRNQNLLQLLAWWSVEPPVQCSEQKKLGRFRVRALSPHLNVKQVALQICFKFKAKFIFSCLCRPLFITQDIPILVMTFWVLYGGFFYSNFMKGNNCTCFPPQFSCILPKALSFLFCVFSLSFISLYEFFYVDTS